jgi:hypothetical protein
MAVNLLIVVFWVVMLYSLVVGLPVFQRNVLPPF